MRRKKLPVAAAPLGTEQDCDVEVLVRFPKMYGKPDKLLTEIAHTLDRELGLRFPAHEISRITINGETLQ